MARSDLNLLHQKRESDKSEKIQEHKIGKVGRHPLPTDEVQAQRAYSQQYKATAMREPHPGGPWLSGELLFIPVPAWGTAGREAGLQSWQRLALGSLGRATDSRGGS